MLRNEASFFIIVSQISGICNSLQKIFSRLIISVPKSLTIEDVCDNIYRYDQALAVCPAIKAIFTADEEAATFLEKTKETPVFQPSVFYTWKKNGILPKIPSH